MGTGSRNKSCSEYGAGKSDNVKNKRRLKMTLSYVGWGTVFRVLNWLHIFWWHVAGHVVDLNTVVVDVVNGALNLGNVAAYVHSWCCEWYFYSVQCRSWSCNLRLSKFTLRTVMSNFVAQFLRETMLAMMVAVGCCVCFANFGHVGTNVGGWLLPVLCKPWPACIGFWSLILWLVSYLMAIGHAKAAKIRTIDVIGPDAMR